MAKSTYSQDSVNALANQHLRVCNAVAELPDHDWTADDGSPSVVYNGSEYPATTDIYEGWLYSFVAYVTDNETFGGGIITKIGGEIKVITGEKPALLRKQVLNIGDVSYEVVEGVTIDIGFTTLGSLFGETITFPAGSTIVYAQYFVDYQDLFEVNDRYGWDIKRYGEMTPVGGTAVEVYAPAFEPSSVSPYNDPVIMGIVCWK